MNDEQHLVILFEKNCINFHITDLYNNDNEICGSAIWLNVGHIEFDLNGMLSNIVTY